MTTDTEDPAIENTGNDSTPEVEVLKSVLEDTSPQDTSKLTKKELKKIERQKQREIERIEKERKKEEERKRKDEEKLRKQREKELERELKKRKLDEEKAEKERKREEERLEREAKKEEERLKKQQAIDNREKARLEKKRKLEEEKEEREVRRRKLEEDKKRKEESQMKISSFFSVKKQQTPNIDTTQEQVQDCNSNDYEREFLPLFVQKNMRLADLGQLTGEELKKSKMLLDDLLLSKTNNFDDVDQFFKSKITNITIDKPTRTPDDVVALLNSSRATETDIYQLINQLPPIKFISFYENSKPPYIGTWCSIEHQTTSISAKDPLNTQLTGFDYDYDSDLEWNKEDEEGEDVDDEDDEEEEDNIIADEDDLGFVEDDQPNNQTKKFQSMNVIVKLNDGSNDEFFKSIVTMPMELNIKLPINPFETITTESPKKVSSVNILETKKKPIIQDPQIIGQIVSFYDSKDLGSFSITTILELVMKQFQYTDKALVRSTLHYILKKDRQTSTWVVKKQIRDEIESPSKA